MRIVTWNCRGGPYVRKVPLLVDSLAPDIAVIQECPQPPLESDQCLWFGENRNKGIAVLATGQYRIRRLPIEIDVPNYIVPLAVTGPKSFFLLAVWSKEKQRYPYIQGVVRAVEIYQSLIESSPTVLIGDLNSNTIWDARNPRALNHSALVRSLSSSGLFSCYHAFHGEAQGEETQPTFFLYGKEARPFHIDYCFVPESWMLSLQSVEIGTYTLWKQHSDHRPLLVSFSQSLSTS